MLCLIVPALLSAAPAVRRAPATAPDMDAQCTRLLGDWQKRFDEAHFTAVVAPPFVIAGDGDRGRIEGYRDNTILAAQRALRATYFKKSPDRPILILLFESAEPYQRLAKKWFGDSEVPHFGFFRSDNIMLMNVGTGTGTLVHELAHALMKPDFPDVPGWFNEGLASLYEQCNIRGDTITGLVNWRLPALQKAIKESRLRPLREMIEDPRFYREDLVGLNYAQARYLMLYLQEQGKLKDYYTDFRDHHADDPTGIKALGRAIAPRKLDDFEKTWRAWVVGL